MFADNKLEFQSTKELTEKFAMEIRSTPDDSPWNNGKCEMMIVLVKDSVRKLKTRRKLKSYEKSERYIQYETSAG